MRANTGVLIVSGHGGVNIFDQDCDDMSAPGWWTRRVAGFVSAQLISDGYASQLINPGPINQPRRSVIGFVNDTTKRSSGNVCLIEITTESHESMHASGYTINIPDDSCRVTRRIAHELERQLVQNRYSPENRGVRVCTSKLINETMCPAISIKAGHVSNAGDADIMMRANEQRKIVMAITGTIKMVFDQ